MPAFPTAPSRAVAGETRRNKREKQPQMPVSHFTFSFFSLSLSLAPAARSTRRPAALSLPCPQLEQAEPGGRPAGLSPHVHLAPAGRLPWGQAGCLEKPRSPVFATEEGL